MKKLVFLVILVLMTAVCFGALADGPDELPELEFVEQGRINYKPVLDDADEDMSVDDWLQQFKFKSEDKFYEASGGVGPKVGYQLVSGPETKVTLDEDNILRLKQTQKKECKVDFLLTAEWCGKKAETHMYIEFFDCGTPKDPGFKSEYKIKVGEKIKLEANYDNGKWKYRDWRSVYPDDYGDGNIAKVWYEEWPGTTGATTYIEGLAPGETTITVTANQNGLNWKRTVKIKVDLPSKWTEDGNEYTIKDKKATLKKGNKNAEKVTIPDTINVAGTKIKVVGIDANAFKKSKSLIELTIGKNVEKIGKNAFKDCENLKKLTFKTKKLKESSVGSGAFKKTNKKITIKGGKSYKDWLPDKGISKNAKYK